MRVVVLHESPGADPAAADFREAAETYNRGLDIRLRFLDVGFEIRELGVREDDPDIAARLEQSLASFRPGVVLAFGRGPRLLECVAIAVKDLSRLAYLVDGETDRTTAAIARLADILFLPESHAAPAARPDARTFRLGGDAPAGRPVVDHLIRSTRSGRKP